MHPAIAGYHILMLLSAVDFHFHPKEDLVIRDFIVLQYPDCNQLDSELEIISSLKPSEWEMHYEKSMIAFFKSASIKKQRQLIRFAINLVKADDRVTIDEHKFTKKLIRKYKLMQSSSLN